MANIIGKIQIELDDEAKQILQDFVAAVCYLMPDKDRVEVFSHAIDSVPTEEMKKLMNEMTGNG